MQGWTADGSWWNYGLVYMGREVPYAARHHRRTLLWLRRTFGPRIDMAGFSMLLPWGKIRPHVDDEEPQRVYHLGLLVPSGCVLVLGGGDLSERRGKLIRFDDSKPHAALNPTALPRVVLYVKLRPGSPR